MLMLPVVESKSFVVNEAVPLVAPSATAFTPVMVRAPAENEVVRPLVPEYVVVATQVGTPALIVRTKPPVPGLMEPSVFAEVKYGRAFAAPV